MSWDKMSKSNGIGQESHDMEHNYNFTPKEVNKGCIYNGFLFVRSSVFCVTFSQTGSFHVFISYGHKSLRKDLTPVFL